MFNQFRNRTSSTKVIAPQPVPTPTPTASPPLEPASIHPLVDGGSEESTGTESANENAASMGDGSEGTEMEPTRSPSNGSVPGPSPYKPRDRITSNGSSASSSSNFPIPTFTTAPPPASATTSTSFFSPLSATGTSTTSTTTTSAMTTDSSLSTTKTSQGSLLPKSGSFSASTPSSNHPPNTSSTLTLTARLQLQSLKAAGQRAGLSNGSWGMKALDAVFEKAQAMGYSSINGTHAQGQSQGSGVGPEWKEIVRVLTSGGATLLLPLTEGSAGLPVTTGWMRDHVLFVEEGKINVGDGEMRDKRGTGGKVVVTMSGLIGRADGNKLVFESALSADDQLLHDLRDPAKRSTGLASIQSTISPHSDSYSSYPSFPLSSTSSTLPFPPIPSPAPLTVSSPITSTRSRSGSNASLASLQLLPAQAGRLNPFASLFGHGNSASSGGSVMERSTSRAMTPPRTTSLLEKESHPASPEMAGLGSPKSGPSSVFTSPMKGAPSIAEGAPSNPAEEHNEGFQIPGWVVPTVVRYAEVSKALSKALRKTVHEELRDLPDKTIERVSKFAIGSHPSQADVKPNTGTLLSPSTPTSNDTFLKFVSADELSHSMQTFLEAVYDELFAYYVSAGTVPDSPLALGLRRKGSVQLSRQNGGSSSVSPTSPGGGGLLNSVKRKENNRRAVEDQAEKSATNGADVVESVLCSIFYNGLFRPPNSDDERHDEALSSRISALNSLDLSLDHLGVMVKDDDGGRLVGKEKDERDEKVRVGLADITETVGKELQSLNSPACFGPKAKAAVMVKAHRLITDGLSTLPKIRLRPDGENVYPDPPGMPLPSEEGAMAVPSDLAAVPPPLPPRPSRSIDSPIEEKTPKPAQEEVELQDTPLPKLELPESAEVSELEEAMMGSITEGMLPSPTTVGHSQSATSALGGGTSGADLLLPLMIFAVVKANPSKLVSQLLYVQRYRSHVCQSGESSYAVVNTTAVVEFLENVDLAELGLASTDKAFSVADLAPIGLNYLDSQHVDTQSIASASTRLRGRVLQVGELAGTAAGFSNKVLTGVVDTGWGALRTLIAPNLALVSGFPNIDVSDPPVRPKTARKSSNFTLANVTASVASIAGAATQRERPRAASSVTREMVDVSSRPTSIREIGEGSASDQESSEDEGANTGDEDVTASHRRPSGDSHSMRSVSSRFDQERPERVSLSDRFANLVGPAGKLSVDRSDRERGATSPGLESSNKNSFLANLTAPRGMPPSRRTTILNPASMSEVNSAQHEQPATPISAAPPLADPVVEIAPPIERFMTCDLADLRLSEIGELLRDYRRLAGVIAIQRGQ